MSETDTAIIQWAATCPNCHECVMFEDEPHHGDGFACPHCATELVASIGDDDVVLELSDE